MVGMLAEGFSSRRGRRGALIHHDAVNGLLRGRRGARLTALTSGGTIPDNADYQVLLEPESQIIGSVNEDLAVESMAGDVFQLGNATYRIQRVERGVVRVEDAHGATPSIPFWLGEAPGRSDELSAAVSRFRADMAERLRGDADGQRTLRWLMDDIGIAEPAALQLVEYLRSGHAALGCLPTQDTIVLERFFDEAGGMQLVVHSPYGSRINRAWGLALAQALLPQVQLRAAGGGDRGQHRAVAHHRAQLRARRSRALPAFGERARGADPGHARCADVHHPLALGGGRVAGAAALPRRPQGAAAARAHERRGPDRQRLSRPDRLRREPGRRARGARPSAGEPDDLRLPHRGHGHRGAAAAARGHRVRRHPRGGVRPDRAVAAGARGAVRAALRLSRRCAAGGAPHAGRHGPALARSGDRRRPRPARPRGDRARARRSLAGCDQPRRVARRAGVVRLLDRGRGPGGRGLERVARGAGRREAGSAPAPGGRQGVDRRGTPAANSRTLAGRQPGARDCRAQRLGRARMEPGGGADRDRARPAGGPGSRCAERARGAAGARARPDRGGPHRARSRRLRHARTLLGRRERRGMVRAPPARPRPYLHPQAPARGDRAGRGARLPALPVRLAARGGRCAHGRARCAR